MRSIAKKLVSFLKKEDGPTAVEYAVMLALIIVVCITAQEAPVNPQAAGQISDQLQGAALDAADANSAGDTAGEIAGLTKVIGLTQALLGLLTNCEDCDGVKSDAQDVIDMATSLKGEALNGSGGCNPNAIVCF